MHACIFMVLGRVNISGDWRPASSSCQIYPLHIPMQNLASSWLNNIAMHNGNYHEFTKSSLPYIIIHRVLKLATRIRGRVRKSRY